MNSVRPIAMLLLILSFSVAAAQELRPEDINSASLASIPIERPLKAPPDPEPAIIRLQVLLDRAGASPGVIDGLYGENVRKAIAGFESMNGLPSDGKLDPDLISRLETDKTPVIE